MDHVEQGQSLSNIPYGGNGDKLTYTEGPSFDGSIQSDSDSDVDDITPPTIIKRKSDLPRKPKSKYKGVFRCGKKFKAQIQTGGVQHYLGLFDLEDDAARAYDIHARATLGPKAKTNFVYDNSENIVPADFVAIQPSDVNKTSTDSVSGSLSSSGVRPKGAQHSKRTYVGIKARRKRMSENASSIGSGLESVSQSTGQTQAAGVTITPGGSSEGPVSKRMRHTPSGKEKNSSWRGVLTRDTSGKCLKWTGQWTADSSPSSEENTFDFNSPPVADEVLDSDNSSSLQPVSGVYSGSYMAQGSVRVSDVKFMVHFFPAESDVPGKASQDEFFVVGKGDSQFGPFVLRGNYNSTTRSLEANRMPVAPGDPMLSASVEELKNILAQEPSKHSPAASAQNAEESRPGSIASYVANEVHV